MSPSATPATRNAGGVAKCHAYHAKGRLVVPSATPATQGGIESQKKRTTQKDVPKKNMAAGSERWHLMQLIPCDSKPVEKIG
jgi:hypothetical protein